MSDHEMIPVCKEAFEAAIKRLEKVHELLPEWAVEIRLVIGGVVDGLKMAREEGAESE